MTAKIILDIKEMINLYNSGLSTFKIGKLYNVSYTTIVKNLKSVGVTLEPNRVKRRFKHNDLFFNIPNEINSYWAGFIAADGCLDDLHNLSIKLQIQDSNHIDKFIRAINSTHKRYDRFYPNVQYSEVNIRSIIQLTQDLLTNFSITPRKSLTLQPPNLIHESVIRAFIRGYFDGDGTIGLDKRFNTLTFQLLGTSIVMSWMRQQLSQYILKIGFPNVIQRGSIYTLRYGGKQTQYIFEWLYQNSTLETRLDRKYLIYQDWLKNIKGGLVSSL